MSGATIPDNLGMDKEVHQKEIEHFRKMLRALLFYKQHATERLARAQNSFDRLPYAHQEMMHLFRAKMEGLHRAIDVNATLMVDIARGCSIVGLDFEQEFEGEAALEPGHPEAGIKIDEPNNPGNHPRPSPEDMEKVYTTVKQFVRDWSAEGAAERERCYGPVISAIDDHFKDRDKSAISVIVPGAGLGRLVWELATRGFNSQGNEWSTFMLLASNYILNGMGALNKMPTHHTQVFPFAHQFSNNFAVEDQLRSVTIPDADPTDLPNENMSMTMGDFLQVYTDEDSCDCIASCFFMDTARNPIVYLETMFRILKPGGILVNLGPLLYHFADSPDAPSVELCYDEIRHVLTAIGFKILVEKYPMESPYIDSKKSMVTMSYKCVLFVAQKPEVHGDDGDGHGDDDDEDGMASAAAVTDTRGSMGRARERGDRVDDGDVVRCVTLTLLSRIQATLHSFRDQVNEELVGTVGGMFGVSVTSRTGELLQRWVLDLKNGPGNITELAVESPPSVGLDVTLTLREELFGQWLGQEVTMVAALAGGDAQADGDQSRIANFDSLPNELKLYWQAFEPVTGPLSSPSRSPTVAGTSIKLKAATAAGQGGMAVDPDGMDRMAKHAKLAESRVAPDP